MTPDVRSQELTDEVLEMFVRDPTRDPAATYVIQRLANERRCWQLEAKYWKTVGKISFRLSLSLAFGQAALILILAVGMSVLL
jgi:hypothetical protein